MMKLILSLTLIWTLSSTAEALRCWDDLVDEILELSPCASSQPCLTVASQVTENGTLHQETIRTCMPLPPNIERNNTFSFNVGFLSASVHMCNTDGCNNQTIPYPDDLKKNNLTCFTCDDPSSAECNKTVQCVGDEDRCISGTVEVDKGETVHFFGCDSRYLCESLPDMELLPGGNFIQPPKCCGSSFCNHPGLSN